MAPFEDQEDIPLSSSLVRITGKRIHIDWPVIEAVLCFIFLLLQTLSIYEGAISLGWLIRIDVMFLFWLLMAAWKRFSGGMHICFLFIGTLLLFQTGRLMAFTLNPFFGSDPALMDPFRFVLMRDIPFDVPNLVSEMTLLAIVSSAVFVYLPCSLKYIPARPPGTLPSSVVRGLYRSYCFTFPFLIYKDIRYFVFVREHGGYLALFLMRSEILSSVDIVTRVLSLITSLAFILIFVFERNRSRIYLITFTFFLASLFDLLIGMRGKVFTLLLTLWFFQNLKRGKHFRIFTIMTSGIMLAYLAMFVANFRENQSIKLLSPLGFISSQGISMQVTEAVVGYHRDFAGSPSTYLLHEIEAPLFPDTQVAEPHGESLAGDLTAYLSVRAAIEGYGSGSSYIAEAYLFGGMFGVIIISLILGCCFAWMHSKCNSLYGVMLLAYTMPALIYLPRSTLLDPLGIAIKTLAALLISFPLFYLIRRVPRISLSVGAGT